MNVLVACEFSGIVREAFRKKGHNAFSCDYLETEIPSPFHLKGDVFQFLYGDLSWDLLIAFPPCTHLCVSGARWFKDKKPEQEAALSFVRHLMSVNVEHICIENPVGIISTRIRKPDQIIQPYEYGHEETKRTCLWLKNLPKLKPTKIMNIRNKNLTPSGQNKLGPSPNRWMERSRTYQGIADAMADQWGSL